MAAQRLAVVNGLHDNGRHTKLMPAHASSARSSHQATSPKGFDRKEVSKIMPLGMPRRPEAQARATAAREAARARKRCRWITSLMPACMQGYVSKAL